MQSKGSKIEKEKLGILLIHGFTSDLKSVDGLLPYLKKNHLKYKTPILRGHGTRFQDLKGVTSNDWYADAEKALFDLAKTVEKVVVVGLSMGGLVSLKLGMNHPDKIAAVVTVAAALKFADPFAFLTPILSKIIPYWPSPNSFNDKNLKKNCLNYKWFPTDAFASLYKFAPQIEKALSKFKVPILIIHSKKDQVISPKSAEIIYEKVSSKQKEIKWFYKSGHEMMQDLEAKEVFETIIDYILKISKKSQK